MMYEVKCSSCGETISSLINFRCLACGQPLEVKLCFDFKKEQIKREDYTVWRYVKFFPYVKEMEIITLGEGWTPLVKVKDKVYFKLENLNPTGSFKDRGSTVLVSALHKSLEKAGGYLSEDSSGNAGASMAAYAARAGLKVEIYVPTEVSGPKFNQIRFYGADVIKVQGSRADITREAQKTETNKFYVGHILHPLFRDGIRSLAYEIAEQLNWDTPERVYLPVSAGTLLLGVISGFRHLMESNIVGAMPKIVACQTEQVSPLYHNFKNINYTPPEKISSIADALISVNPPLLNIMVKNLREANGDAVLVRENEIFEAFIELAKQGFFVEPSSAVAYAAYKKQLKDKEVARSDSAVIILTGTGLKTTLKLD